MPNTVVKLTNAESTWLEAAREDRKLLINQKSTNEESLVLFCCAYHLRSWAFVGGVRRLPVFPKVDALRARVDGAAGPYGPGRQGFCLWTASPYRQFEGSALGRYEVPLRWRGGRPLGRHFLCRLWRRKPYNRPAGGGESPFGGWRHHLSPASGGTIKLRYAVSCL